MFYILDTSSLNLTVRPAIVAESKIDNDDSRFVVFIWLLFKFCLVTLLGALLKPTTKQ